jgi:cytochrome c oxidase accessory protein FixG
MARMKLDAAPLSARKFALKAAKHGVWIAIALWTGFTFVGYFTPIRELWDSVWSLAATNAGAPAPALGPWETFWVLFYGFATYGNAGWMREQVCKYMCPYARFQSAMFDKDTLIITYDPERGEPRGKGPGKGHCVDCSICVQVCPTGIDIRDGLQYECIGCAACIDGCDRVMEKVGFPKGLIRYSTQHAMEKKLTRGDMFKRAFRPRVLVYSAILWIVIIAAGVTLWIRVPLKVDVIRDRAAISREVAGGLIENVYRLQIMNTSESARAYRLSVSGIAGIRIPGETVIEVDGAASRMVPVSVRIAPGAAAAGTHRIDFGIESTDDASVAVREKSVFIVR